MRLIFIWEEKNDSLLLFNRLCFIRLDCVRRFGQRNIKREIDIRAENIRSIFGGQSCSGLDFILHTLVNENGISRNGRVDFKELQFGGSR